MMKFFEVENKNGSTYAVQSEYDQRFEQKSESVFSQCSGYLGVRAANGLTDPNCKRDLLIAGIFNRAYKDEVTELVNCPDICSFRVRRDGTELIVDGRGMTGYERRFCIETGELEISYRFKIDEGQLLEITEKRFASFDQPHVFAQRITFKAIEGDIERIQFLTGIDGQMTNTGVSHFVKTQCRVFGKDTMLFEGILENYTVNIATRIVNGLEHAKCGFELKRRGIDAGIIFDLSEGTERTLSKITYVRTDRIVPEPESVLAELDSILVENRSYEELFKKHREVFGRYRDMAGISVKGLSERQQAAIDLSIYHLAGMMPWGRDDCSIASKALTGEGYKGHVFWDTEAFLFPFYLYLFPDEARNLLTYRYHGLEGAHRKAEEFGYKGAMYPWEAADDGKEETPKLAALNIYTGKANPIWSGLKEHHISADIAYAIAAYDRACSDAEFMRNYGYEMSFEIAEFWYSRSVWDEKKGRFVILDIIGPDEYTEHIDNNAYTNYMAYECVKYALSLTETAMRICPELCDRLELKDQIPKWEHFIECIYLPEPDQNGIIPQDDTFLSKPLVPNIEKYKYAATRQTILREYSRDEVVNMQCLKQADAVMLLNLYPHMFSPDIVKKNVLFYEERTIHDSSLSYCTHAQACAMIGESDTAYEFFEKSLEIDFSDNPYESRDGIHAAAMGGIWNTLIKGFAGVTYEDGILFLDPSLPEKWTKISFRLNIKGCVIFVEVSKDKIDLEIISGQNTIPVVIKGQNRSLTDHIEISYN